MWTLLKEQRWRWGCWRSYYLSYSFLSTTSFTYTNCTTKERGAERRLDGTNMLSKQWEFIIPKLIKTLWHFGDSVQDDKRWNPQDAEGEGSLGLTEKRELLWLAHLWIFTTVHSRLRLLCQVQLLTSELHESIAMSVRHISCNKSMIGPLLLMQFTHLS